MSLAIIWTTSSLTGGTIITITLSGGSITYTLARALLVVMGGSVRNSSSLGILHVWGDLIGSLKVNGGSCKKQQYFIKAQYPAEHQ